MIEQEVIRFITRRGKWADDADTSAQLVFVYPHPTEPRWAELVIWRGDPKFYPTQVWWDGYEVRDGIEVCMRPAQTAHVLEELILAAESFVEISPQVSPQ